MRLKQSELKALRLKMLKEQNYICPLCGSEILEEEAALDHDHETGKVRAVLHRSCNQAEGRIKSWINRSRFDGNHEVFIENLLNYIKADYSENLEHPTHLTKKCRKFNALKKEDQVEMLSEMKVKIPEGKLTKKDLTKLYRKAIK